MFRDLEAPVQILPESLSNIFGANTPWPEPGLYQGSYINYHQLWDNDVKSFSVFGSFDYAISEEWRLSGGVRYTNEDRSAVGGNLHENSGALGFGPVGLVYNPSDETSNTSPELTVSYFPKSRFDVLCRVQDWISICGYL